MIISLYRILVFDSPGASPPAQGWMLIPSTPQALATPWQLAEHCIVVPGSKGTIQGNPHPCIIRNAGPSIHSDSENKNHRTVWNRGSQLLHFFSFFLLTKTKYELFYIKTGSEYIMAWQQGNTITFFINFTFSCFRIFHFVFFAWKSIKILSQQKDTVI